MVDGIFEILAMSERENRSDRKDISPKKRAEKEKRGGLLDLSPPLKPRISQMNDADIFRRCDWPVGGPM